MVNVLEIIQLIAAGHWKQSGSKLPLLLTNRTGYSRLAISCLPTDIVSGLLPLIVTAVGRATSVVEVTISIAESKLMIAVTPDEYSSSSIAFDWDDCCVLSNPLPPIILDSQSLTPITNDSSLVYELSTLAKRLNLFDRLQTAADDVAARTEPTFFFFDCRLNPEIANYARQSGRERRSICLYDIDQIKAATLQSGIPLFWPYFDSDLICLLNGFQRKLMVLLADDSKPSQITTQVMLERLGCQVVCADDGEQALAIAESKRFDLIFLDERMPHMNGSEVANRISQPGSINSHTDKISLTGVNGQDAIEKLFDAGITQHIEKPIKKSSLESFLFTWRQYHTS
ncbi:response regulator [Pseudomaricurvus alcaniphilus]|uniref:response regulator n=1 Tax=Pseudomaricurvus alcaniphilus TaxID=1166482 RepID=UPI00140873F9|nr:response regulator [Pseudomaricurvus alcaniphilus]NHN37232.1 response regulator [Pseudomaricurvus alcaniphilus]